MAACRDRRAVLAKFKRPSAASSRYSNNEITSIPPEPGAPLLWVRDDHLAAHEFQAERIGEITRVGPHYAFVHAVYGSVCNATNC